MSVESLTFFGSDDTESLEQGTDAWRAARLGHVTGSQIKAVLAKGKGATRAAYRAQVIAERLTGEEAERFVSAAMRHGTELEPVARLKYEVRHDVLVEEVGFVLHPEIPWAGASPDGLVGAEGMVQIKCPLAHNHVETVIDQEIPNEYIPQMQWELACTGRLWSDYVSFNDKLPDDIALFVKRLPRDDHFIAGMEREVRMFLAEVDEYIEKLRKAGR